MEALAQGELRQVQLAQQDRASLLQLRHHHRIFGGYMVPLQRRPVGGANSGGVELVLNRHRNSVQRPPVLSCGDGLFGLAGCLAGLLVAHGDVRVHLAIDPVDAFQVRLGGLDRRDLPGPDQPSQFGHAEEG